MAARKCLLSLIQNEILCNFCQAPLAFFWGWDLRCFGIVRSVEWYFVTDVSGQTIGPIFKDQAEWLTLEDRIDRLSRNVANKLAFYAA